MEVDADRAYTVDEQAGAQRRAVTLPTDAQPGQAAAAAGAKQEEVTSASRWSPLLRVASAVVSLAAVAILVRGGVLFGLQYFPKLGGTDGGSADEFPPADASARIRVRRHIDDVFMAAVTPGSWPHWHAGSEMVSGEIDTEAEPGNRVREHLAGSFTLDGPREMQWTVHTVKQPKYSLDGDGSFHAIGYDVHDPDWRVEIR